MLEAHESAQFGDASRRAAEHVVDLDAEETVCPACETPFRTAGATRCPECGLNFGG